MKKKYTALLLAGVLVVGCAIGGTTAWLMDTAEVKNTFTVGNIDITLTEEETDFKMVPGEDIDKDPLVTVEADSEDCWLFVELEKSSNYDTFLAEPSIATGWTVGNGSVVPTNVCYRKVSAAGADQSFGVLVDDKVTVLGSVTKDNMDSLTEGTLPTLTFIAYAVQQSSFETVEEAWGQVSGVTVTE